MDSVLIYGLVTLTLLLALGASTATLVALKIREWLRARKIR